MQLSAGQTGIGILQLCVFVPMPQLPLHSGISFLRILVLFRCTLTFILVSRCVGARRFFGIFRH